jgi:pantetheine-phosphate adenylyltransferase
VYNFKEPPNSTYSEIMNFLNVLGIHTKKEMSNIFFSNPAIKDRFEKLINPIILDVLSNWLENTNIIVEFPLLFRNDFEYLKSKFDLVISITADVETRKARIRFRNNFSDEKIEAIFNSQPDQKYVDVHSDIVFENHIHNIETRKQSIVQLKNIIDQKESQILQIRPEFVAVKDEKIGFVPGSFDPIQRGHLYVIQKALSLVDSVIVVIAHNDSKIPRFNSMEKSRMIKESIIEVLGEDAMSRVRVDFLKKDELLITHAKWCNAKFLFRGLRSGFDYDYEHSINASKLISSKKSRAISRG